MAEEDAQKQADEKGAGGLVPKLMIGLAVVALQVVLSVVVVKKFAPSPRLTPVAIEEKKAKSEGGNRDFGDVYLVEDVIVNPAGSRARKFLNASVAFVYSGKVGSELEKRDVQLRDMLLRVLGSYTAEQLADPAFRDSLRRAILEETNGILRSGEVDGVYFANFVMQ
ncbi:hypothetical protein DRJ54_08265 [Candidatus Acetothermia bacterium]|nr:MAG: hypothetical protein DRJ54_08265 [Candidatus Acetothermia bacterium]